MKYVSNTLALISLVLLVIGFVDDTTQLTHGQMFPYIYWALVIIRLMVLGVMILLYFKEKDLEDRPWIQCGAWTGLTLFNLYTGSIVVPTLQIIGNMLATILGFYDAAGRLPLE